MCVCVFFFFWGGGGGASASGLRLSILRRSLPLPSSVPRSNPKPLSRPFQAWRAGKQDALEDVACRVSGGRMIPACKAHVCVCICLYIHVVYNS